MLYFKLPSGNNEMSSLKSNDHELIYLEHKTYHFRCFIIQALCYTFVYTCTLMINSLLIFIYSYFNKIIYMVSSICWIYNSKLSVIVSHTEKPCIYSS